MPVLTTTLQQNIWVAAGEGDIHRVRELVENESFSPNAPDQYTYTPMHAAASYGHIHVLEYLASKGGDVNVKDVDDETPLFAVETVEVARWLVEHGARTDCENVEGHTPAQHLAEEFPAVAAYLSSLDGNPSAAPTAAASAASSLSEYHMEQAASQLTQTLLTDAYAILQHAEVEGRDPDPELREMVGRAMLNGWSGDLGADNGTADEDDSQPGTKRPRLDDAGR